MLKSGCFSHTVELQKPGAEKITFHPCPSSAHCWDVQELYSSSAGPTWAEMLMCFLHCWPWIVLLLTGNNRDSVRLCRGHRVIFILQRPLVAVVGIVDMISWGVFGKKRWFLRSPSWQTQGVEYTVSVDPPAPWEAMRTHEAMRLSYKTVISARELRWRSAASPL